MSNQVPAISRKNDAIHTAMCAHGWPAGRPLDGANNAAKILIVIYFFTEQVVLVGGIVKNYKKCI